MPYQQTQWVPPHSFQQKRLRCLLLGINGAGMTAAAEILIDAGHTVFGMDAGNPTPFPSRNCAASNATSWPADAAAASANSHRFHGTTLLNWDPDAIPADLDVCVSTRAVAADDPLTKALAAQDIRVIALPTFLAEIFAEHRQLCVAGTHGKSTTSAMLTWILEQAGRTPSCFVGAHQLDVDCSGRFRTWASGEPSAAASPLAVIESCEFRSSFLEFAPSVAVITGIERDHFDCFPDAASEDAAFAEFVARAKEGSVLVHRADCSRSVAVARQFFGRSVSFEVCESLEDHSTDSRADWLASRPVASGLSSRCELHHDGRQYELRLSVPGLHNIHNAIAAIAAANAVGVDPEVACQALGSFHGIRRRFELRGHYGGMTLIDDYAHHPTAIRETLQSVRQAFPGRRIIAAFEPHQHARTTALFNDFVQSLALADEILILPVFAAREQVSHLECCRASGRLVKALNSGGGRAFLFASLDQIVSRIDHSGKPSDIFVTMGAGRTNLIHDELTRRLQRNSVA